MPRKRTRATNADPERVNAAFKDGVLTVTIGKRAEAKPRVVDIKG